MYHDLIDPLKLLLYLLLPSDSVIILTAKRGSEFEHARSGSILRLCESELFCFFELRELNQADVRVEMAAHSENINYYVESFSCKNFVLWNRRVEAVFAVKDLDKYLEVECDPFKRSGN